MGDRPTIGELYDSLAPGASTTVGGWKFTRPDVPSGEPTSRDEVQRLRAELEESRQRECTALCNDIETDRDEWEAQAKKAIAERDAALTDVEQVIQERDKLTAKFLAERDEVRAVLAMVRRERNEALAELRAGGTEYVRFGERLGDIGISWSPNGYKRERDNVMRREIHFEVKPIEVEPMQKQPDAWTQRMENKRDDN